MVGAATGAGAGGLKIRGILDTSMIERGFTRVKQGFASVKGFAKGFTADLTRMKQETKTLAKGLGRVALIGSAAIIGLASKAPAVAPALAKIGVTLGKLSRTMGEALAPAFEKVSDWLDKLAGWAGEHPDIFSGIVVSLSAITALKFVGATGFLTALGSLIIAPATLTALGYLAVIGGIAYAGAKGAEFIADKTKEFLYTKAEQIPGTLPALRSIDQDVLDEIRSGEYRPTTGGMISAAREEDRRSFLLQWWDALWG